MQYSNLKTYLKWPNLFKWWTQMDGKWQGTFSGLIKGCDNSFLGCLQIKKGSGSNATCRKCNPWALQILCFFPQHFFFLLNHTIYPQMQFAFWRSHAVHSSFMWLCVSLDSLREGKWESVPLCKSLVKTFHLTSTVITTSSSYSHQSSQICMTALSAQYPSHRLTHHRQLSMLEPN